MSINAIKGSKPSLPPMSKRELDSLSSNNRQGVKSNNTKNALNKIMEPSARNRPANETTSSNQIKLEELTSVVSNLNNTMKTFNNKIKFDIDNRTNQVVVKIIDQESNEVIRQIPPKEILNIAARLEELSGILFNKEV